MPPAPDTMVPGGPVYLNNPGYGIVNGQILDRGGRLYVNAAANISADSGDAPC